MGMLMYDTRLKYCEIVNQQHILKLYLLLVCGTAILDLLLVRFHNFI